MKKSVVYVVALGVACTVAGAAIGSVATRAHIKKNLPKILRADFLKNPRAAALLHRGSMQQRAAQVFQRVGRELNLSEEQETKVKNILDGSKQEVEQVRDEFMNNLAKIKEGTQAKITELLSPEQREKFEQLKAAHEKQKTKWYKGR